MSSAKLSRSRRIFAVKITTQADNTLSVALGFVQDNIVSHLEGVASSLKSEDITVSDSSIRFVEVYFEVYSAVRSRLLRNILRTSGLASYEHSESFEICTKTRGQVFSRHPFVAPCLSSFLRDLGKVRCPPCRLTSENSRPKRVDLISWTNR